MRIDIKQVIPAVIAGMILGAGLCLARSWHRRHGPPSPERMIAKMSRELGLEAAQKDSVKAVFSSHREKFKAFQDESQAQFQQLQAALDADIEKVLDPEQRRKFAAYRARRQARHKKWKSP